MSSFLTPAGPKAPVNKFWFTLGVLLAIVVVVGSLYLGLWLCLIGGIVQVVEACKSNPVSSMGIALGFLRFIATGIVSWGSFFIGCGLTSWCFGRAYAARNKQKLDHLNKVQNEFFGK